VAILKPNAETHLSVTNALGMLSAEQAQRLAAAVNQFPEATWVIALHHHPSSIRCPRRRSLERREPRSSTVAGSSEGSGAPLGGELSPHFIRD
jgi:hypothetical protein